MGRLIVTAAKSAAVVVRCFSAPSKAPWVEKSASQRWLEEANRPGWGPRILRGSNWDDTSRGLAFFGNGNVPPGHMPIFSEGIIRGHAELDTLPGRFREIFVSQRWCTFWERDCNSFTLCSKSRLSTTLRPPRARGPRAGRGGVRRLVQFASAALSVDPVVAKRAENAKSENSSTGPRARRSGSRLGGLGVS